MKKYPTFDELKNIRNMKQKRDELELFQYLLRNSDEMNERFHGKARAIADGLQPWIDALEISLSK